MEQIRKIVRKYLFESYFENVSKPGEYSTEEMERFLFRLIKLIPFDGKQNVSIPSSWPASSVSFSKDSLIQNWEEAKRNYPEPDTKWYVWKTNIGGSLNKPKQFSAQRFGFEGILNIVSKNPESFRNMSVGATNETTRNQEKNISTKGD